MENYHLAVAVSIILSLIGIVYKLTMNRIDKIEKENKEIKENYISRFDELKDTMFNLTTEIKESNHRLADKFHQMFNTFLIQMNNEYIKKSECNERIKIMKNYE